MSDKKRIIVEPAYGRDYNNGSDAVNDWRRGLDFKLLNVDGVICSTYCSTRDFSEGCRVEIRYQLRQKLIIINNKQEV